jgi:O-antigen/teichoic acid export membrane protein
MMLKGLGRQVYAMGVNILDSVGSILLVLLLLPSLGAVGYVYVILIAEVFNFSLSFVGLRTALPFRFPIFEGVLLPIAALLPAVTLVRRLPLPDSLLGLVLSFLLSFLLYALLLLLLLRLFGKKVSKREKAAPTPLDRRVAFGYNKGED